MMAFLSDSSGRREAYRLVINGVLNYFREIDRLGGTLQAKAEGFFRDEIAHSSMLYDQQVRSGKRSIIALNRYVEGRREDEKVFRGDLRLIRLTNY